MLSTRPASCHGGHSNSGRVLFQINDRTRSELNQNLF
jgi:hypothetical protein